MKGPYSQLRSFLTWATGDVLSLLRLWDETAIHVLTPNIIINRNFAVWVNVLFFSCPENLYRMKKAAMFRRPLHRQPVCCLSRYLLHLFGIHIEVRVDVLGVVEIFKSFEQPDHRIRLLPFELGVCGSEHCDFT